MAIVKHNKLIETSYKLNSREQFFILYLISQISQTDRHFREYTMTYREIENILNFDGKRRIANKAEVFGLMDKLNSEPILYEKGNIIGKSVWLQHMEHNKDTDEFTFSLSEKLREYLLQLKEHFTRYNIQNIIYLSGHSIRLYELLKRFQYKDNCEFTIDKLKFYLGIENKYPKFYEFKRWVLAPSQAELARYTDIRFTYEPAEKDGKKVLSLVFEIEENQPRYSPDVLRLLTTVESQKEASLRREYGENADLSQLSEFRDNIHAVEQSIYADRLDKLGESCTNAFRFLAAKGVNKSFIMEEVLQHKNLQYEVVKGFEDVYIKRLWHFLEQKSKSRSIAAAFVTWWKKGKLTASNLHAGLVESILLHSKKAARNDARDKEQLRQWQPDSDGESSNGLFGRVSKWPQSPLQQLEQSDPQEFRRLYVQACRELADSMDQPLSTVQNGSGYRAAVLSRMQSLLAEGVKM